MNTIAQPVVLLLLYVLSDSSAVAGRRACYVKISDVPSRTEAQYEAYRRSSAVLGKEPMEREAFLNRRSYKFQDPEGFAGNGGNAFFLNAANRWNVILFRAVAGRESFDFLIESELEKRGAGTQADWHSKNTVTLSNQPPPKVPGQVHIFWTDVTYRYEDGLIALGDEFVLNADLRDLREMAMERGTFDERHIVRPYVLPEAQRRTFLAQVSTELGVHLQRTDQEVAADHRLRSSVIQNAVSLFDLFLMDVESLEMEWEVACREPRFAMSLVADRDSRLHQLLRDIQPKSGPRKPPAGELFLSSDLSIGIPPQGRDVLSAFFGSTVSQTSRLGQLLTEHVKQGQLCLSLFGDQSVTGEVVLGGVLDVPGDAISRQALLSVKGFHPTSSGSVMKAMDVNIFDESFAAGLELRSDPRGLAVLLQFGDNALPEASSVPDASTERQARQSLLEFSVDLAKLAATEQGRSLLLGIEQAYAKNNLWRRLESVKKGEQFFKYFWRKASERRESVLDRIENDLPMTLSGSVRSSGRTLHCRVKMSEQVYLLYKLRQQLNRDLQR